MTTGYWSATSLAASTSTSWARVSGIPHTDRFSCLCQIITAKFELYSMMLNDSDLLCGFQVHRHGE